MDPEKLDRAMEDLLESPRNTSIQRLHCANSLANLVWQYARLGVRWQTLDCRQQKVFDVLFVEARRLGLL